MADSKEDFPKEMSLMNGLFYLLFLQGKKDFKN